MGIRSYIQQAVQSTVYYGSNVNRVISEFFRDPYFNFVTLLLHGDGTNGKQNKAIIDSSSNAFPLSVIGNTTQGTLSPFGDNWSNYFDGNGDTLSTTAVNISSGDFTVEAWVYLNAMPTSDSWPGSYSNWMEIIGVGSASVADGWQFRIGQTVLAFGTNGDITAVSATHGMVAGRWYHLACVRSGIIYSLYVNGLFIGSAITANNPGTGAFTWIGSETNQGAYLNGYISNVRLVTSALYTSNFTPSTTPLTAISGTILLACQSNRFRDNSTNNYPFTLAGNVSIQKFSPFSPTSSYSSTSTGGSISFDGTGDYIFSTFSNSAFAMGTGDFTFETWIYPRYSFGGSTYQTIAGNRAGAINSTTEWTLGITNTGTLYLYTNAFNIGSPALSAGVLTNDQWYHLALVRSSGTATLYVNGVFAGSANMSGYNFTDTTFTIGANDDGSEPLSAILSNCRLLKGTALYTATFTPPTAPLTNITNTSLLLNGTNAGIFDNAMMNNLETVGNAQISTTQSKFGGSSIQFTTSAGDRLVALGRDYLALGAGNFTLECWVYPTSFTTTYAALVDFRTGPNFQASYPLIWVNTDGKVWWQDTLTSTNALTLNTWTHVSFVRNSGTITVYLNGISNGSISNTTNWLCGTLTIGAVNDAPLSYYFRGNIDDLRITKGFARYTTNFTPPTAPFEDF